MINKLACAILLIGTLTCPALMAIKEEGPEIQDNAAVLINKTQKATSQNDLLGTLSNILKGQNSPKETQKLISLGKLISGSLCTIFGTLSIICVGQAVGDHVKYLNRHNLDASEFNITFAQVSTQIFLLGCLWKHVLDLLSKSLDNDIRQNKPSEIAE
jgi:hypothetical protein